MGIYSGTRKIFRVILLEDEETVNNVFFDRGFKGVDNEN
jgi:hypothetical protein